MNAEQLEAIANADAHTNNAGLPTYTAILDALQLLKNTRPDAYEYAYALNKARVALKRAGRE